MINNVAQPTHNLQYPAAEPILQYLRQSLLNPGIFSFLFKTWLEWNSE